MQFSATSIAALFLAALTGQALGAPAITPVANDNLFLEKRCDCHCKKDCQKDCQIDFAMNLLGVGDCVISCAPTCGCSEYSKC